MTPVKTDTRRPDVAELGTVAAAIRRRSLEIAHAARLGHPGGRSRARNIPRPPRRGGSVDVAPYHAGVLRHMTG